MHGSNFAGQNIAPFYQHVELLNDVLDVLNLSRHPR